MKIQDILEAKRENHIFMRFGAKKPIAKSHTDQGEPYLVGYAGFVNTPAELTIADAKWKFNTLTKKEDFVTAIKKIMADKTFTAASGVTIYIDSRGLLSKFPSFGEFIDMIEKMGGSKVAVEYKPTADKEKSEKLPGKKREPQKWANPRDEYDTPEKQTTKYFTVTNPRLMDRLRKNDRVMQYYRPNRKAFVMAPKEYQAFINAFGRDDIKIVGKFTEDALEYQVETATAGGTSAGGIAGGGFAIGIGSTERAKDPTKKKTKSKLIKR
jgi:hypothetical protein